MKCISNKTKADTDVGTDSLANAIADSDASMRHYPSVKDGDVIKIQLNFRNASECWFPNRQKGILLWDSGATYSLISQGTITNNDYLKNIKPIETKQVKFMVGNGTFIVSKRSLVFNISVRGHVFQIKAHIVPTLGGISVIVGTQSLKELEAELHFKSNVLKFRTKEVKAKIDRNAIIKPGTTRLLSIKGHMPEALRSAEVYFRPSKFLSQLVPSLMLVKMNKHVTRIAIHNSGSKMIKINKEKPIGTFLLKEFGTIPSNTAMTFSEMTQSETQQVYAVSDVHTAPDTPDRHELYKQKRRKYPFLEHDDKRLKMTDEEILRKDIDLSDHCMSKNTLTKFWKVLEARKEAFSIHGEVGECDISVKIKLKDESPFFIRPYPVSEKEKDVIDKEMNKLVKMGILTYGKSSYVSPILLLKKKNNPSNPYRLVSDFRVLNAKVVPLHYCTPLLRDALQIIGNSDAKIFSTIDIKNAFYSLRVHPESQKYLTIAPYQSARTLKYLRLPQGLSISPTEWSDQLASILNEIPKHTSHCLAIADDIAIYSKNETEHLKHVERILGLFEKHGLKLSVNKCQFFKKEIDYMGHRIKVVNGRPSVTPQKSKIDAINKMQPPRTPKQTKSLIGMIAYLSMYVPKLQILLVPMHKLTRKGVKFEWTSEMQQNFEEIKKILSTSPLLTLPTKEGLFRLYCDTSKIGVGATLCQVQNGEQKILAFFSKKLAEAASKYTISELEGTGMLISIHAFRHLLRSAPFEVITDHSPLTNISNSKNEPPTLRLKKIFERLSDYKFTLIYQQGKKMVISDHFSRHPTSETDDYDPIAFLMEDPSEEPNENSNQTNEFSNDATLYVSTRSSTRCSGETLKEGLQTSRRSRSMSPVKRMSTVPSASVPLIRRGNGPERPIQDEATAHHRYPTRGNAPLPLVNENGLGDPIYPRPNDPARPIPEPLMRPKDVCLNELPTRLTDMTTNIPREYNFREDINVQPQQTGETHTRPEEFMYKEPTKIFSDSDEIDIFHRNIPKQNDIKRMLKTLSKKLITDAELPVTRAMLAKEQAADPYLKPIYNWLKYSHLPERARAQRKLKVLAEDFALIGDILFKMNINEKDETHPLQFPLAIPESYEKMIFFMAHESLYSNHMGVTKTYLTLRKKFFIKNLYAKLTHYIRSCHQCQCQKTATDVESPYEMRLPKFYIPFARLSADVKHMPLSSSGNKFLLVVVCEITRYCYAFPIKKADAQTIAEVLLRKIVLTHGEPDVIITDEGKEFNNQVTDFLWKTVRTKAKTCSPYNHGSLQVERHIQSISNLIMSNLKDTGANWDTFCESATFAINTHVIPRIKYSPYYLVFLRNPPTLTELRFSPLEEVKSTYREYVQFLQQRLEHVGKSVLNTQAKLQSEQAAKHMEKVRQPNKYREGALVYLNAPSASSLKTNTLKFKSDYCGPLYIKNMLGTDKTILSSLDGRVLHGVYHINRLKPGFIRLENGSASHIDEVRNAYTTKQIQEIKKSTPNDVRSAEHQGVTPPVGHTPAAATIQSLYSMQRDMDYSKLPTNAFITDTEVTDPADTSLYMAHSDINNQLGAPHDLSLRQQKVIEKHSRNICQQGEPLNITKVRCKNGHIQLCLQGDVAGPGYAFWYEPGLHPENSKIVSNYLEKNKLRVHGSLGRLQPTSILVDIQ